MMRLGASWTFAASTFLGFASGFTDTFGAMGTSEDRASSALNGRKKAVESVPERPEFIDYLNNGNRISLAIAIDFTASNGDPRQKGNPHFYHPPKSKEQNDYEKAILAAGSILAKYDSNQKFPVWGFGAKRNNVVRHCFQCGKKSEVEGVEGIMDAYRSVFQTPLTMSYPSIFTEVIETAANYARYEQKVAQGDGKLSYTILLILTVGNVEDAKETKRQILSKSIEPLSVVIVGVGEGDFSSMEFLDAFDATTDEGRDMTKFVRFNGYKNHNSLKEDILGKITGQLVDFYSSKGKFPGAKER